MTRDVNHRTIRFLFGHILDEYNLRYRVASPADETEGWWKVCEYTGDETTAKERLVEGARTALGEYIHAHGLDDPARNQMLCFRLVLSPGVELVNMAGAIQPTIYVGHE